MARRTRNLDICISPWNLVVLELALLPLIFFLPGYFIVNSMFPGKGTLGGNLDLLYRVFLSIVTSVSLVIVYGTTLVLLGQGTEQVLFRPDYLWPGLAALSVVFFIVGVMRGAYPRISAALGRQVPDFEPRAEVSTGTFDRLVEVTARLDDFRRRASTSPEEAESLKGLIEGLESEKARLEEEAAGKW